MTMAGVKCSVPGVSDGPATALIQREVNQFQALCAATLVKLQAARKSRAAGDCKSSGNIYQAFINEVQAQSGKHIDPTAAAVMIGGANYLIAHCP